MSMSPSLGRCVPVSTVRRWVKVYRLAVQTRFPIRMDIAAVAVVPPILRPATGLGAASASSTASSSRTSPASNAN